MGGLTDIADVYDALNPIFTLSALYRVKSPEYSHKVGVMGYQNSSWDICDLTRNFRVQKKILGPGPGARKVGPPENLSISKFGFFDFEPKLEAINQG